MVAVAVSAPFGGLDRAHGVDSKTEHVQPGTPVAAAPFKLVVTGASAVDKLTKTVADGTVEPLLAPSGAGNHVMALRVSATNESARPVEAALLSARPSKGGLHNEVVYVLSDASPLDASGMASVYDADDATDVRLLNPGVTYHLVLAWEYAGPVPATLDIGLARLSYDPDLVSKDVLTWQHPAPLAQVTVPVKDRTS